ncbi:MAG TPA: alpha/beta hydrolase, partial [Acidimicrobiales bacterium]
DSPERGDRGGTMASTEYETITALLAASPVTPASTMEEIRDVVDGLAVLVPPGEGTRTAEVDAGGVGALWVAVDADPASDDGESPVVLHFHGGGYVMAGPHTHVALLGRLISASGGRSLSVDYRLAPEHPFPAAADDALTVYRWLLDQGVAAGRIVVAGDSAGGGLALGLLVAARDAGLPQPAGALLLSPWVDLTGSGATMLTNAGSDAVLGPLVAQHWATLYAGDHLADPAASPLFADLAGLAPITIQVGSREILLDDAVRLTERLVAAGVEATLAVWDDLSHWWQLFTGLVPEADQAVDELGAFAKRVTAG